MSLFRNIAVEHHFPLTCPFWDSLQVIIDFLSGNVNVTYNWKNRCTSSAKSFTFDIKLLARSFMYIKNSNGPKRDPCGTPALRLFDIYYPENFERVLVSYQKHLLLSIYLSNLHAKPYQKLWHIQKFGTRFLTRKVIKYS